MDHKGPLDLTSDLNEQVAVAGREDPILVTGANGFIGSWVVRTLLSRGFKNVRCLTRAATGLAKLDRVCSEFGDSTVEVIQGNLLSRDTCTKATNGAALVYHLAAGVEKTFPGCFLNSAVTTRNLLDAVAAARTVRRFVNISSLAVYSNAQIRPGAAIDEACPIDMHLVERYDPYAYGKATQDEIVRE
jgi:nucleoside-diphosphate-sugar epimerase